MLLYGPVAQLGERSVRIREVVGSNPFRSTKKETPYGRLFFGLGGGIRRQAPKATSGTLKGGLLLFGLLYRQRCEIYRLQTM